LLDFDNNCDKKPENLDHYTTMFIDTTTNPISLTDQKLMPIGLLVPRMRNQQIYWYELKMPKRLKKK
jgi:hypothetical protein